MLYFQENNNRNFTNGDFETSKLRNQEILQKKKKPSSD